jgi:predicted transposase/invertase (TIGR01784 family)
MLSILNLLLRYVDKQNECFKHKSIAQKIFVPTNSIQLISLSAIPDEVLITHKRCAAMSLAQKYIRRWDLTQLAPKIFELFERYPISVEKRNGLLYYLAKEGRGIDKQFVQSMVNITPHYRENIMSAAQYLIEEGRQEGLQKGRQEAALEIAKNLLTCGIQPDLIKQVTQLSNNKITALSCH